MSARGVALVTGASSGIGAATAVALAQRGYAVGLVARRRDRLEAVAARISETGPPSFVCTADVGVRADAQAAAAAVRSALGPVDVLVNNAGMPAGASFLDIDVETAERVTAVNYLSAVWFTKAVLPDMVARGSGTIVNVASIVGRIAAPGAEIYAATKFVLVGLSESLGIALEPRGVRVVCVNPGPVRTESWPHARIRDRLVLGPDAVARTVVEAIDRGTPEVTVPRYYAAVAALRVIAPPAYRRLLRWYAGRR